MHEIQPFSNWRLYYKSEEDEKSVFYDKIYNTEMYSQTVYNYYIDSEWDCFGSNTLYLKILFVDYKKHYAIIEFIGEWNDAIENDIMLLKQNVIDELLANKITKFILITESVFNFFKEDDDYYVSWHEKISEKRGWIAIVNMPVQSKYEFDSIQQKLGIVYLEIDNWRTLLPQHFYTQVKKEMSKQIK